MQISTHACMHTLVQVGICMCASVPDISAAQLQNSSQPTSGLHKRLGTPGLESAMIGWTCSWLNNNKSGSILLGWSWALGCIFIKAFDGRIEGTLSRFVGVRKDQGGVANASDEREKFKKNLDQPEQ